jgi:GTP-binding protein HflX
MLKKRTPRTLIGPGQVEQVRDEVKSLEDDCILIVNTRLSPTQQRNLERETGAKVLDRTALILEIFGERASTREGRLQVELAALNYQKSRLVRSWTHLERQRGGAGFMGGPGETQIETDRRIIGDRIVVIKKQLEKVVRTRELHRKRRRDVPFPLIALAGYTNAGKSTLFNRLTESDVVAEDQLFATLDPTISRLKLDSGQVILLSDTVGFVSDLPTELVAAFRATLEEVREADIILHVQDAASPERTAQAADVEKVLKHLLGDDYEQVPQIVVANKVDMLEEGQGFEGMPVSALTGEGCDRLLKELELKIQEHFAQTYHFTLPYSDGKRLAWLHANGRVVREKQTEEGWEVEAVLRPEDAARFIGKPAQPDDAY